jgi:hypothetical protein
MNTSRRDFIKTTVLGTLSLRLLPVLGPISKSVADDLPLSLPRASPESQGVSSKAMRHFIEALNASELKWHSFMLLRKGHVIAEGWWKPFEPEFTHTLYSLSKSFTSTAIGLLVKEGKLNIEDKVLSFFPKDSPSKVDEHLKQMNVKHLLTMNTGHSEDTMPKLRASGAAWTQTFLAQNVDFRPGTHFLYNTGATYMLGAIVYQITGETLESYLTPRLFKPLAITGYDWELSPQGLNAAGVGLRIRTEDIAKFGQLYLQKGKWNGKEILTESWVKEATRSQTKTGEGNGDWDQGYGYQFWRCQQGFYRGDGAFGQFCIVLPEYDAVLAVTGENGYMQKSLNIMWAKLLPAIKANPSPENEVEWAGLKNDLKQLVLPIPKVSVVSPLSSKYHGKKFKLDNNDFTARETQFAFLKDACIWTTLTAKGTATITFGWENWMLNKDSNFYPFPVSKVFPVLGRIDAPSKFAGTATWLDENTLQLNIQFVESVHGDKIICTFNDEKLTLTFMNSLSEHSNTDVEKRKALAGLSY